MLVHCKITPSSMSLVPIYTPGWRQTIWGKVSCLSKQHNGRDWAANHRPSDLKSNALTTTPPRPTIQYETFLNFLCRKCSCITVFPSALFVGILPSNWRRYTVPKGLTVLQWVADFSDRIKQLQKISHAANTGGAKGLKVCHLTINQKRVELVVVNPSFNPFPRFTSKV